MITDTNKILEKYNSMLDVEENNIVDFNQNSEIEADEININKEKGEGEVMAIKKELDEEKVVVQEEANQEAQQEMEIKEEATEKEEKVEESAEEEKENVENNCGTEMEADDQDDDAEEDKEEVEEECIKEEANAQEGVEEELSKAERKTFEARIATLEQNVKTLKSELKAAEPYKALYEESLSKIKELEAYKEDKELDELRVNKLNYAKTCNFDALEDEDKEVVQEKIDDYKFSLYDFKAFMADVLKKYSRKQVYSNMEKIISYFSVEDNSNKADEVDMPSDKNMSDRILDKYSNAIV